MEMREKLTALGCDSGTHDYLGDGVYYGHDGFHVWLVTEKDGRFHEVALEEPVLARFWRKLQDQGRD